MRKKEEGNWNWLVYKKEGAVTGQNRIRKPAEVIQLQVLKL